MMYGVGVDIGGTFIKYAIVSSNGLIKDQNKIDVIKDKPQATLNLLCKEILLMIKKNKIKVNGIGIGMPGILEDGKLLSSANLKKWVGINVSKYINKRTKLKTYISNDANVACLAEAKYGAGKGCKNVILLTLGTGVGGGLILNNELYEGNKGQGAELGHTIIAYNGKTCGCGRRGCFEAYASATALTNLTIAEMNNNRKSYMWNLAKYDINNVDASIAWKAEKYNDISAKRVINQYITYLSEGILNFCNIFRPDVIILSGGVAKQKTNLTSRVNKYLQENEYGIKGTAKVRVLSGRLGYDSGVIGAATLVFSK